MSQTGQDEDLSENEVPDDQDVGLQQEGNNLSDHLEDTTTTSGTPAQRQSQIPKAKDSLPKLSNNSSASAQIPDSGELQTGHGKSDAPRGIAKNEPKQDMDEIVPKQDEGGPNQNDDSSDIEILSNPDSVETIPLDDLEEDEVIFNVSEDYDFLKREFGSLEGSMKPVSVNTPSAADPGMSNSPFSRKRKHSSSNRDSPTLSCSPESNR